MPAVQGQRAGGGIGGAGDTVAMVAHRLRCVGEGTCACVPGDGAPASATGGMRTHVGGGTWGCVGEAGLVEFPLMIGHVGFRCLDW